MMPDRFLRSEFVAVEGLDCLEYHDPCVGLLWHLFVGFAG